MEGFAPTSRAAQKLAESGMETSTLQKHLMRGEQSNTGEKRLYVLDESSLASTRQFHEFVHRLHSKDRVLLVGDRRQHEAVEAGRPFAQLQDAGMVTVRLEEIVRQKDPELKRVVEQLACGQVHEAVESLDWQGRVHEISDHNGSGSGRSRRNMPRRRSAHWLSRPTTALAWRSMSASMRNCRAAGSCEKRSITSERSSRART